MNGPEYKSEDLGNQVLEKPDYSQLSSRRLKLAEAKQMGNLMTGSIQTFFVELVDLYEEVGYMITGGHSILYNNPHLNWIRARGEKKQDQANRHLNAIWTEKRRRSLRFKRTSS